MGTKVKLSVLGFSFNQNKTGAYGLVLSEEEGIRRLMVVVGTPEAQSIAFQLQGVNPPRPLTHDLFYSVFNSFDIVLREVEIYRYVDGVFYARLMLMQGDKVSMIESRTSDAIGIALRTKAPIYTTEEIMQEQGVIFDESVAPKDAEGDELDISLDYSLLNKDELETMLKDAIEGEDYELASILRDELDKKNDSQS